MQTVSQNIAAQIGNCAFTMMGTRMKIASGNSLIFDVRGSKKVNKIVITLEPSDTYKIEFFKISRKLVSQLVYSTDDIYNDQLKEVIERHTGLYLSL
jgi:hypothetical protein